MSIKPNQLEVEFLQSDKIKLDGIEAGAQVNPAIASQVVAEAGVDNSQYMTALRVKQAIDVFASSAGESNTGTNVGTGEGGVFKDKSGLSLRFRTIKAGTNVTVTQNADDITISAIGGSGAVDSVNGFTGIVVLDADDIDDTSTTNKFITASGLTKLSGIETGAQVNYSVVSQAEAEAGTATTPRTWTAQRVKQAIDALALGGTPLTVQDDSSNQDTNVNTINFTGSGVTASQTSSGVVEVNIPGGSGSGHETRYLTFDSGRIRILASGTDADLDSVTATKDFSVSAVSRLILNRPSSVQYHSVAGTFTAGETTGRTEIRVECPEPNGSSVLEEAIRPIAFRLNVSSGVANTGGVITLSGSDVVLTQTGYTGGTVQRIVVQF